MLIAAKLVKQIKATKCNDEHNDIGIAPFLLKAAGAAEIAPRIFIFGKTELCSWLHTLADLLQQLRGRRLGVFWI